MRLHELEHVLRAARNITDEIEFVVIGSQAILARFPDAPLTLTYSDEVDIYPLKAPEKSDQIDGAIGELSPFHEMYGYYAHGVAPETAVLPRNWRDRSVRLTTPSMEVQLRTVFIQLMWRTLNWPQDGRKIWILWEN